MALIPYGVTAGLGYKHDFQRDIANLHSEEALDMQHQAAAEQRVKNLTEGIEFGTATTPFLQEKLNQEQSGYFTEAAKVRAQNPDLLYNTDKYIEYKSLINKAKNSPLLIESTRMKNEYEKLNEAIKAGDLTPEEQQMELMHYSEAAKSAKEGGTGTTTYDGYTKQPYSFVNPINKFDVDKYVSEAATKMDIGLRTEDLGNGLRGVFSESDPVTLYKTAQALATNPKVKKSWDKRWDEIGDKQRAILYNDDKNQFYASEVERNRKKEPAVFNTGGGGGGMGYDEWLKREKKKRELAAAAAAGQNVFVNHLDNFAKQAIAGQTAEYEDDGNGNQVLKNVKAGVTPINPKGALVAMGIESVNGAGEPYYTGTVRIRTTALPNNVDNQLFNGKQVQVSGYTGTVDDNIYGYGGKAFAKGTMRVPITDFTTVTGITGFYDDATRAGSNLWNIVKGDQNNPDKITGITINKRGKKYGYEAGMFDTNGDGVLEPCVVVETARESNTSDPGVGKSYNDKANLSAKTNFPTTPANQSAPSFRYSSTAEVDGISVEVFSNDQQTWFDANGNKLN